MAKLCFFDTIDDSMIVNTFKRFVKKMVFKPGVKD